MEGETVESQLLRCWTTIAFIFEFYDKEQGKGTGKLEFSGQDVGPTLGFTINNLLHLHGPGRASWISVPSSSLVCNGRINDVQKT